MPPIQSSSASERFFTNLKKRMATWFEHFNSQLLESHDFSYLEQINLQAINLYEKEREVASLTEANKSLQTENIHITKELKKSNELQQDHPKIVDLMEQLSISSKEQQDLYKTNAQSAQRILSLIDSSAELEQTLKKLKQERQHLENLTTSQATKISDLTDLVTEKDKVIQILKDELQAIQLELSQREQKWEETIAENKALLERWIKHKETEMSKMNEANIFVESALKSKLNVATKVFSFFSTQKPQESNIDKVVDDYSFQVSVPPNKLERVIKSGHEDEIMCLGLSNDGQMLATGGADRKVVLYSTATGLPKSVLAGHTQAVMSVAFNQTNDHLVGSSNDNSIKIWKLDSKRIKLTLTGHTSNIYSARYSGPETVVSGSHGNKY
jgi:autophagy-related protein 16